MSLSFGPSPRGIELLSVWHFVRFGSKVVNQKLTHAVKDRVVQNFQLNASDY
jgi:hypothetical protein